MLSHPGNASSHSLRRLPRLAVVLALGVLAAGVLPASASDQSVTAKNNQWCVSTQCSSSGAPLALAIDVNNKVTWSNPSPSSGGGCHNVVIKDQNGNVVASNGDVTCSTWNWSHSFTSAGSFTYYCATHEGTMSGTLSVGTSSTTTSGTTTTTTSGTTTTTTTTTTGTTTSPTSTTPTGEGGSTTGTATDTTAPAFLGKIKLTRVRTRVRLAFTSSEAGRLSAVIRRRAAGAQKFKLVARPKRAVVAGPNSVRFTRVELGGMKRGAYRIVLVLIDPAGNRSATKTVRFKVTI